MASPVTKIAWDYNDPSTVGQVKRFDVWELVAGVRTAAKLASCVTPPTDAAPLAITHGYRETTLQVVPIDQNDNEGAAETIGISATLLPKVTNLRVVG